MRKILIATHGHLASGFASAISILAGDAHHVEFIDAYTEDEPGDFSPKIVSFVQAVAPEDEAVVFTDLMVGSVNQKVCQVLASCETKPNLFVVTGSNLAMLLAVVLEFRSISREVLDELAGQAMVEVVEFPTEVDGGVCDDVAFLE